MEMDITQKIKASIDPIVSLSDEELLTFCSAFILKSLKRNEFFLEAGDICNYIGLLIRGSMIYIKPGENGDEITTDFAFEGDWVNSVVSRLTNTPSALNIKALEDSEILVLKQGDLNKLYFQIPKIERLGRILTEQAFIRFVEQAIEFQTLTAKERYENLLKNYPEIFQKVQLYHIANYLGIAPKSLSRIRKELFD
jgi:CRP/FNR family transcriptional regulator, anaerobic regulatory protein